MEQAKIGINGNDIIMVTPYSCKQYCQSIPGARWNKKQKAWKVKATPFMAYRVYNTFNELDFVDVEFTPKLLELMDNINCVFTAQKYKEADNLPSVPTTNFDAWDHQKKAFWYASSMPSAMLAMGMGTGKTKVSIDLIQNSDFKKIVILCPKKVVKVWPKEFKKHLHPDLIDKYKVFRLDKGSTAKRAETIEFAMLVHERIGAPVVIVLNYESTRSDNISKILLGKKAHWDFLILDESHKIKAPGGSDSKFCQKLAAKSSKTLELTGTPMPHSPLDIYAQYRTLDIGIFGGSYTKFKEEYAELGYFGQFEQMKPEMQDDFSTKFNLFCFQCGDEVLDLPPFQHNILTCELTPEGRKLYDNMENELFAQVDNNEISASNVLTKLLRLQQIAAGSAKFEDGIVRRVDNSKQELLEEVLSDLPQDEAVAIFCKFHADLDTIHEVAKNLDRESLELSGRVDQLEEWEVAPKGKKQILAVQLQAGGVGVDLTRTRYCIYYNADFSLGNYEQSLKRVHRAGQKNEVIYYHLIALNTVDQKIYSSLAEKKDTVANAMQIRKYEELDIAHIEDRLMQISDNIGKGGADSE